jgi:tungstate transport system ATP-binding protein
MRETRHSGQPNLQISINNLCLDVRGSRLLDQIHLTLNQPGVTMILGPNGAGKSLLLKCIHGLSSPTRGSIDFDGSNKNPKQAMVFQRPVLLRRSVMDNMRFADQGTQTHTELEQALDSVQLLEKTDHPATQLSGGEQQRLALARALLTKPDLLLLDEPTASLDPASVVIIERLIQQATQQHIKSIFISHDIGQARRLSADVIFLNRGQVVEYSDAAPFFSDPHSDEARAFLSGEIVL